MRHLFHTPKHSYRHLFAVLIALVMLLIGDWWWYPSRLHRVLQYPELYLEHKIDTVSEFFNQRLHCLNIASQQRLLLAKQQQLKLIAARQQHQLQQLQQQNKQLRALSQLGSYRALSTIIANIARDETYLPSHQLILYLPEVLKVNRPLPVFVTEGLLGTVEKTSGHLAWVELLTKVDKAIPARVQRTGSAIILTGQGYHRPLIINHLANDSDIQVGDKIVTSNLGGVYPEAWPIGKVIEVRRDANQPVITAIVQLSASIADWHFVLLLSNDSRSRII